VSRTSAKRDITSAHELTYSLLLISFGWQIIDLDSRRQQIISPRIGILYGFGQVMNEVGTTRVIWKESSTTTRKNECGFFTHDLLLIYYQQFTSSFDNTLDSFTYLTSYKSIRFVLHHFRRIHDYLPRYFIPRFQPSIVNQSRVRQATTLDSH
jgi:hypothetical protein